MRSALVLAFLATSLAASTASAQPGRKAMPEKEDAASFAKRGAAAMAAGNYVHACPLLAHSYELAPKLPTLFSLAECDAKGGNEAAALEQYKQYVERLNVAAPADQAREAHNRTAADAQIAALERTVPELTIVLPPDAPEGSVVRLDGRVAPFLSNVRVEAGEHEIALEMKDGRRSVTKLAIAPGDHKKINLTPDGKASEVPSDAAFVAGTATLEELAPPPKEEPRPERPHSKLPAIVVGALGVAGVTVGSVYGIMAIRKSKIADSHCMDVLCDSAGKQAADKAKVYGWVSTGAFAAGVIGLGASVFLFVSDGSSKRSTARAWEPLIGAGYVGARGSF